MDDSTNKPATADPPTATDAPVTTDVLTTIINVLKPLTSEERQRTVGAAMLFLGETALSKHKAPASDTQRDSGDDEGDYPPQVTKWMKQNGISAEELDRVYHFNEDGTFDLLHAPGRSKKEQTQNTYVLTGLGKYLTTNQRTFDDATARDFCEKIGCIDPKNHATNVKDNSAEYSGDKGKGYSLTNVGIKRGAALVKEVASAGG